MVCGVDTLEESFIAYQRGLASSDAPAEADVTLIAASQPAPPACGFDPLRRFQPARGAR